MNNFKLKPTWDNFILFLKNIGNVFVSQYDFNARVFFKLQEPENKKDEFDFDMVYYIKPFRFTNSNKIDGVKVRFEINENKFIDIAIKKDYRFKILLTYKVSEKTVNYFKYCFSKEIKNFVSRKTQLI